MAIRNQSVLMNLSIGLLMGLSLLCMELPARAIKEQLFVVPELDSAAPVVINVNSHTEAVFKSKVLAFNRRTLIDAYQNVGEHNRKWDQAALRYLEDVAQHFTSPRTTAPAAAQLDAGRQLMALGCNDPLIQYCYGIALLNSGDGANGETVLAAATQKLLASKYPVVRQRFAATRLAYLYRAQGFKRQADFDAWRDRALELTVKSLQDGSYGADEQRIFFMHLIPDWTDLFLDRQEQLYRSTASLAGLDPWLQHMVAGLYHSELAYKARGGGWGYRVTDEGWAGYTAGLAEARKHFVPAWQLHPEYPEAAARMISVANGDRGDAPDVWFTRATRAQFDYIPAYRNYMFTLWPRWGGSHKAMLEFGLACLMTWRFDTAVPLQYFQTLEDMVNDVEGAGTALWSSPAIWEHLQQLYLGYIQCETRPMEKWVYQTDYAAIAWRTGHYSVARQILDELGTKIQAGIFVRDFNVSYPEARAEIYAFTGALAEDLKKADLLVKDHRDEEAMAAYRGFVADASDSNVVFCARQRLEKLQHDHALSRGAWLPLKPGKDLKGWTVHSGNWKVEDDGAIVGESTAQGLLMVCDQLLAENMEIRGEVEFISTPYKYKTNAGIVVGYGNHKPRECFSCLFYQAEAEARIGAKIAVSYRTAKPATVATQNTFLVRIENNKLSLKVNNSSVFDKADMEDYEIKEPLRLGLCGNYWYPSVIVRFKNIEVRVLK